LGARTGDVGALVERARAGQARAIGRLISLVEDGAPELREIMATLTAYAGNAQVVGLTGAPGVGKSTATAALVSAYRGIGRRVAVLAVDPSSPFSGGAVLGDRVRMQAHATDEGVFIRSMASRGHLGGLASATPQALRVLDAAGFDVVLVETVGVGQSEIDVAALADTTLVLVAPGMGDSVQAAKAGLFEIGDIYVVNKADRDGAPAAAHDLRHMISLGERREAGDWRPSVVLTVASRGEGLDELLEAIDKHRDWLTRTGELARRRRHRAAEEVAAIALGTLRARMGDLRSGRRLGDVAAAVAAGEIDPYAAADSLLDALGLGDTPDRPPAG
jgi:LAO/AO transport system kinase